MLQTDRILLRAPEPSDLDFLYGLENDTALWPVSLSVTPFSREALRQYLEHATLDIYAVRQVRLMVCQTADDKVVGTVDLFDFEPLHQRAGVGIALASAYRQQGYGQETLQLLEQYATQVLQLHQLYCSVAQDNTSSLRLFKGAGFQEIGVRKDWLRVPTGWQDVVELQKLLPVSLNKPLGGS
ncbi:GNAT family N-acetyltransferase [Rufibacter glacialis]|uniref:GNAT family N-acetyltransferase n=1 Tax=Rufibacter glacialis TaxID=1259555 RepID=A0A5M8QMN2_9BACT|nr:GNAT family N-acetyltransferase [Rufibacter glacialis]KAA6437339.1 GNAT family N-acetyltransferase [Rufibacter glacialis]GGK60103.1 N-acetyltransferase [Rufibacter glacialis]